MTDIPKEGSLKDHGLPGLLVNINRNRVTGILVVTSRGITKKVFISKGEAIFASSSYADDRLGEMLLKSGKITVQQYDKSVEILKKTGKRQGAILVELGYLTPKDLFWGVKYQVEEIIYSLFDFEDGDFNFDEGEIPGDEVITLKMSMGNLIYEGVNRIENWTKIRSEMPDTETILKLSDDPLSLFQGVELSTQDKKILSLIDGKRAIRNIIEDSWLNSFEALKALYMLWSIGIIIASQGDEGGAVSVDEILSPVSLEEEDFMNKVNNTFERLSSISYFEILDLSEQAGVDEIKKNYYAKAKEFHPDRFYDSTDTIMKDRLAQIFDALTDAYNTLKDKDSRTQYLASIGNLEAASSGDMQKAEDKYTESVARIKVGDFSGAASLLEEAVSINPGKPEYWNYAALAYSKTPGKEDKSEGAMIEAIKLDPTNSDFYANLGLLYVRGKRMDEAKKQFQKALAMNPNNKKAQKGMKQGG